MNFSTENITVVGVVVVFSLFVVKEFFYDKKKELNKKVDSSLCEERTKNVNNSIHEVKRTVDEIYDFLLKGGKK